MTARIYFLCCVAAILLVNISKAQLIPGYVPPIYNVPRYVNQGLNTYRQTQRLIKAANDLGLPVQETQKLVTEVTRPLLPQAQNLATNVGLPLLPPEQRAAANVGLALLPKAFPAGLPILPQLPSAHIPGVKLRPLPASTLLLSPIIPRINPLQIRSTDEKINNDVEKTAASINPLNEVADDEFKQVVGSSGSLSNETTTDELQPKKPRSPDHNEGMDELDYLAKAANPIDEIGTAIKKVGHGLKHTIQKIDHTLWPSHAQKNAEESVDAKESGNTKELPYQYWAKNHENTENNYKNQGRTDSITDIMQEYLKMMNSAKSSQGPQFQLQENLASGLSNVMDEFQQSMSQSTLGQNGKSAESSQKNNDEPNDNYHSIQHDTYKNSQSKQAHPINRLWNSASKLAGQVADAASNPDQVAKEQSESNQRYNPMNKIWNSASKFVDNVGDSITNTGKSSYEVPEHQRNNPTNNFAEKASSLAENNQFQANPYAAGHYPDNYQGYNTNNEYYYGNGQMYNPFSSAFGSGYTQWNHPAGAIWNSATNLAQNMAELNNGGGNYKSNNPSETLPGSATQYTGMYPMLSRNYRQLPHIPVQLIPLGGLIRPPLPLPLLGRPFPLLGGPIRPPPAFGRPIRPPFGQPRFFKRSGPTGNIWDSATGLAGSIASITTNPGKVNSDQILGSVGSIWNAANNMAGDIGNVAVNPGNIGKNQFLGSNFGSQNNQKSNPIESDYNLGRKAAQTLGSSNQGDSLLKPNNPIGTIMSSANHLADDVTKSALSFGGLRNNPLLGSPNPHAAILNSASDLGSKITNIALNPGNVANGQLFGATTGALGSISNQGLDMAGKIVNTAFNPGLNINGQLLQSLGPTYAGGFFPRNNPTGSIVNSATQLAGQILNTATNPGAIGSAQLIQSPSGIGNYAGVPLGSIWNSATK